MGGVSRDALLSPGHDRHHNRRVFLWWRGFICLPFEPFPLLCLRDALSGHSDLRSICASVKSEMVGLPESRAAYARADPRVVGHKSCDSCFLPELLRFFRANDVHESADTD